VLDANHGARTQIERESIPKKRGGGNGIERSALAFREGSVGAGGEEQEKEPQTHGPSIEAGGAEI